MVKIRPSVGWVFVNNDEVSSIIDDIEYISNNFDGYELPLFNSERLNIINNNLNKYFDSCHSVHLSTSNYLNCRYDFVNLLHKIEPEKVVLHPNVKNSFRDTVNFYNDYDFNLLIENMDTEKDYGRSVEWLSEVVRNNNTGFCYDLVHAYDSDPSLEYGKNLFNKFDNINEFHVSGRRFEKNHSLVHLADNTDKIITLLKYIYRSRDKEMDLVIEGHYKNMQQLETEEGYIRDILI